MAALWNLFVIALWVGLPSELRKGTRVSSVMAKNFWQKDAFTTRQKSLTWKSLFVCSVRGVQEGSIALRCGIPTMHLWCFILHKPFRFCQPKCWRSEFFFLRLLLLVSVSLVPVLDGPCRLLPFNLFPDRLLNSQYRFQFEPRDRKRLNGRQAGIFILTLSSASLLGNEPSTRHAYHLLCVLKICSCRLFAYPFTLCLAFMSVSLRGTTAYFTLKVPWAVPRNTALFTLPHCQLPQVRKKIIAWVRGCEILRAIPLFRCSEFGTCGLNRTIVTHCASPHIWSFLQFKLFLCMWVDLIFGLIFCSPFLIPFFLHST